MSRGETVSHRERIARATLTWAGEPGATRLGAVVRVHRAQRALELIRSGQPPADAVAYGAGKDQRVTDRWQASVAEVARTVVAA